MKLAIFLVLVVIALQLVWNFRRAKSGLSNIRMLEKNHQVTEGIMIKFGEQRELVKELQATYERTNRREDSKTTWAIVEFWKQESIKHLCEFDFASALALMSHAAEQARHLIDDSQRATPSITANQVLAFLERQRLKVDLKTAPQLL